MTASEYPQGVTKGCCTTACTGFGALRAGPSAADRERVARALAQRGGPAVPHNFAPTAPGHDGRQRRGAMPQRAERNPQV